MKIIKAFTGLLLTLIVAAAQSQITPASQWTWIKGGSAIDEFGVYGIQGVASNSNKPGGRYQSASWKTSDGTFWIFGGYGLGANGSVTQLNDLWKYNPVSNQWTWVRGDSVYVSSHYAVYGTQGVASSTSFPGDRYGSVAWVDGNDKLWLFGGVGRSSNNSGFLNDLWKYDPVTNQWTWMKGANINTTPGTYGVQTVPASGARGNASGWSDAAGNFWLFGGTGMANAPVEVFLNDLWKYNPLTNLWTWMKGNNTGAQQGVYGTKGVADTANKPGGRFAPASWYDNNNNLWLLGGGGYGAGSGASTLNDLWKFDISTNSWTWMKGDSLTLQYGNYGVQGTAAAANKPGGRQYCVSWTDRFNNLWLFGGFGSTSSGFTGDLNDLWKYDILSNNWVWMKGDNTINQKAVYGTQGIPAGTTKPGSKGRNNSGWIDNNQNLWLFGGVGYGTGDEGLQNELWKLDYGPSVFSGAQDNFWENAANWSSGSVPNSGTDVLINSGIIIVNSNAVCRSLKVIAPGSIKVNPGFTMNVLH